MKYQDVIGKSNPTWLRKRASIVSNVLKMTENAENDQKTADLLDGKISMEFSNRSSDQKPNIFGNVRLRRFRIYQNYAWATDLTPFDRVRPRLLVDDRPFPMALVENH